MKELSKNQLCIFNKILDLMNIFRINFVSGDESSLLVDIYNKDASNHNILGQRHRK